MELLVYLFPLLLWGVWSAFQGAEEGIFVIAKQGNQNPNINHDFHDNWTFQRIIVGMIVVFPYFVYTLMNDVSLWECLFHFEILCASMILLFPFIHDGVYFQTANNYSDPDDRKLPYPKGWKDYKDGKAVFDFAYRQRVRMFIVGCLGGCYLMIQSLWVIIDGFNLRNVQFVIIGVLIVIFVVYQINNKNSYLSKWRRVWMK